MNGRRVQMQMKNKRGDCKEDQKTWGDAEEWSEDRMKKEQLKRSADTEEREVGKKEKSPTEEQC